MNVVDPMDRTTLLVNSFHEPLANITARAALRQVMNGSCRGLDATGAPVSWIGEPGAGKIGEVYAWGNRNVEIYPDQPCLRSERSGEIIKWPIPTILIASTRYGMRANKNGSNTTVRAVYKHYKGICQYCFNKIPFADATRDHVYPKSKGGTNEDVNYVLACLKCNGDKADTFPYYDAHGKIPVPKPMGHRCIKVKKMRPEWNGYPIIEDVEVHHV